jgi:cytochrome c peroxidase
MDSPHEQQASTTTGIGQSLHCNLLVLSLLLLAGCDSGSGTDIIPNTTATPDTPTPGITAGPDEPVVDVTEIVPIGEVRTIQVNDVVFSSLPENIVSPPAASVALGRALFWDPILSGDQDVACATCHLPEFGYADGRARSIGAGGVGTGPNRTAGQIEPVTSNAQSVLNTVWNGINELGMFDPETAPMSWVARTESLAVQALEPIRSRVEMRGDNFSETQIDAEVISRLQSIPEYPLLFEQAYGTSQVTLERIGQALADFQSTLIANNTPYDRYLRGDTSAMNNAQLNGMAEFAENGCAECHSGPMFSDFETHVLGVAEAQGLDAPDTGDGNFAFRTPSLRQLAFTAPYFHGGQENQLDDAIDFYDNNNNSDNPNVANNQLDADFRAVGNLNNNEINAIEAFLNALNDPDFDRSRPASVPSGLSVGGSIDQ